MCVCVSVCVCVCVCMCVAVGVGTKIINNQEGPATHHNKWQFAQDCSNHSNLEMEAECLTKTLSYLNLNISRTKNGRNKL